MSKDFFHRQKLAAVPADGYVKVYKDSNENVGAVPEYVPINLLGNPATGITPVYLDGAIQTLTAGSVGAVGLTGTLTRRPVDNSGFAANSVTLADGTIVGQVKTIEAYLTTGAIGEGCNVYADNFADGTTLTLLPSFITTSTNRIPAVWTGIWTGTAWRTINVSGRVDIS